MIRVRWLFFGFAFGLLMGCGEASSGNKEEKALPANRIPAKAK